MEANLNSVLKMTKHYHLNSLFETSTRSNVTAWTEFIISWYCVMSSGTKIKMRRAPSLSECFLCGQTAVGGGTLESVDWNRPPSFFVFLFYFLFYFFIVGIQSVSLWCDLPWAPGHPPPSVSSVRRLQSRVTALRKRNTLSWDSPNHLFSLWDLQETEFRDKLPVCIYNSVISGV